jgi:regulator of sigma E protease
MMANFISWVGLGLPAFLFVITLIVFFHELGHFLVGRFFNVRVNVFSIGFGREIIGWNDRKGTRWKISWLPLGGYVRFAGDADASSRPDRNAAGMDDPAQRATMLQYKPLYQRALVVAAGPLANFLLAIVIFAAIFMTVGEPASPPIVDTVAPGSGAAVAGLRPGDVIRSVDGKNIAMFSELQAAVSGSAGRMLHITVLRDGMPATIEATPLATEVTDTNGKKQTIGRLGISNRLVTVGPVAALARGAGETWEIVSRTMTYLAQLVTGRAGMGELSGPIGIAKISGEVAEIGFMPLLNLAALVSVSIGLVNLFPIPVLDGGHLLYYACEAILGRPLGERAQELGFRIGLAFMLSLMLLATFNDLTRFNLF